ncbi:MAG: putative N-acetylmannosamine-6-phosphate 2-epimerase [Bryobacterales bacterium]
MTEAFRSLRGKLIVSCQAPQGDVFEGPENMARFACAAIEGGAAGIRANGAADVRAIRRLLAVPILGIRKRTAADGETLITTSLDDARELVATGADMLAIDCTARGCSFGALERLRQVKAELGVPIGADIATLEEAQRAVESGADFVLSTMRGYEVSREAVFESSFIAELVRRVDKPVIAEGGIRTRQQAQAALAAGAFAIVVGAAITRPGAITAQFTAGIGAWSESPEAGYVGIDLGGTNIKYGVVAPSGSLEDEGAAPTIREATGCGLLAQLTEVASEAIARRRTPPRAVGVSTAGWVDARQGRVVYATGNVPGWAGARIAESIRHATGPQPARFGERRRALLQRNRRFDQLFCSTGGTPA